MELLHPVSNVLFGFDADKTYTPATVREPLPLCFVQACVDFNRMSNGGFFTFTNSARYGLDDMMHGHKLPALVSQGTMCRFETGGEFELHPELSTDITDVVDDVDRLARELIQEIAPEYAIITKGSDLHSGHKVLKPEHKETCYCIVFPETMKDARKRVGDIIQTVHHQLGLNGIMGIDPGIDATELVALTKTKEEFNKWMGAQWVMDSFSERKLVIAEDSNLDMLERATLDLGSFNIFVADEHPQGIAEEHIHARQSNIDDFRRSVIDVVNHGKETDHIDLDRFRQKQPIQPRITQAQRATL